MHKEYLSVKFFLVEVMKDYMELVDYNIALYNLEKAELHIYQYMAFLIRNRLSMMTWNNLIARKKQNQGKNQQLGL